MNILIVGTSQFPFGSASASRLRHFAVGLKEAGAGVRVISQIAIQDRPQDIHPDGTRVFEGVRYESVLGYDHVHSARRGLWTKLNWFRGFFRGAKLAAQKAAELIEQKQVDLVFQYNRSHVALSPFINLCKKEKIPLVIDVNEWPTSSLYPGGFFHPFYWDSKYGLQHTIPKADGIIAISKFLSDYYARKNTLVLRVPAIIEIPNKICHVTQPKNTLFNIVYVGKLIPRDGIQEILSAIKLLLKKSMAVQLSIIGASDKSILGQKIKRQCESDDLLKNSVSFLGFLSDEELKKQLTQADALVFVRPDDITARAAFPTRLPEYLVTGRPVITAGVGDIPEYLRDEIDAMVVTPCTPKNIAEKIAKLMQLPDRGMQVGQNGFKRAAELFNSRSRTREMYEFFELLIGK